MNLEQINKDKKKLLSWYSKNKRPFPWRENRDPYRIWISETMLQQTTTTAVQPFFKRFIAKLPTLKSLALSEEPQVLELWSGLGYYSRARNLHKASKLLYKMKSFPQLHTQLLDLPGFGPYTSRAVSSLAFGESVGVLDGNVIRILSRNHGLFLEWWKTKDRQQLQTIADQYVRELPSNELNQALMELGATICTPKSPKCILCPWLKSCIAHKDNLTDQLPLKKAKKDFEIWVWEPIIAEKKGHICLIKNTYAPFLKKQWLLPGSVSLKKNKPKDYDFTHSITHHKIFIKIQKTVQHSEVKKTDKIWVRRNEISQWNPTSLIKKTLSF